MESTADIFDFVMVIVSIVIGLGMTEILAGLARLLRARTDTKPYWLHTVVVIGVFIALLSMWWEVWGLQSLEEWSFLGLIFMLTGPVGLYLIASLIFPDQVKGHDFREYYYQNSSLVWSVAAFTTLFSNSFWTFYIGGKVNHPDNYPSFLMLLIALILIFQKKPLVHAIGAPIFFVLILADQLIFRFFINQ